MKILVEKEVKDVKFTVGTKLHIYYSWDLKDFIFKRPHTSIIGLEAIKKHRYLKGIDLDFLKEFNPEAYLKQLKQGRLHIIKEKEKQV